MRPAPDDLRLTRAEAVACTLLVVPAATVLLAYVLDLAGVRFLPWPTLALVVGTAAAAARVLWPRSRPVPGELALLALVVVCVAAWLLWLARPALLPLSTGPDLTHHLMLVEYIEQHWHFVHDRALADSLGEMAQYTPGSHVLAALGGAWSGTDGTRALHTMQVLLVALKAGFLLLIGVRLLPVDAPRPLAVAGVLLLLAAPRYALGAFTEYGFVAQVVAEVFAVAMWWAVVAWDAHPDWRVALAFSVSGAAAFLSWPVYVGPPVAAFALVLVLRASTPLGARLRDLCLAFGPFGLVALSYLLPRLGWLRMAGTGGDAPWPTVAAYSAPLTLLAVCGVALAVWRRRGRATAVFALVCVAQAVSLYVLAVRAGAEQPYMAEKMCYLLLWPMAGLAVMTIGDAWSFARSGTHLPHRLQTALTGTSASWLLVFVILLAVALPLARKPQRLHPLPPALSVPVYDAGRWARAHLPAQCIEYLVGDDETSYWLHLAVLGNPRRGPRTADWSTYDPKDAIVRWLTPGGLPWAIADLSSLPRTVREELDVAQFFGTAAIVKRRGATSCDPAP